MNLFAYYLSEGMFKIFFFKKKKKAAFQNEKRSHFVQWDNIYFTYHRSMTLCTRIFWIPVILTCIYYLQFSKFVFYGYYNEKCSLNIGFPSHYAITYNELQSLYLSTKCALGRKWSWARAALNERSSSLPVGCRTGAVLTQDLPLNTSDKEESGDLEWHASCCFSFLNHSWFNLIGVNEAYKNLTAVMEFIYSLLF